MKSHFRTLLVIAMILISPIRHFGQTTQVSHNQETIEFNITDIDNFDQRIFFLYNLMTDGRFEVINSERDGYFVVSASEAFEGVDLSETFADFKEQNATDFIRMSKEQAAEMANEYKGELPYEFVNSLMMDVYLRSRDNNTCANADPFCTDNGLYQFPAGVNAGSGESGPYYDCLYSQPNPAWYYMRIANPGNINITMYSTPSVDIDFCCWGPFSSITNPSPCSSLTSDKVVSCSYSTSGTEVCQIPASAQTGDYFILIITNYSNQTCNISFSKTGGNGTTDCGILPPVVDNDGPYCVGETIHLTANGQAGATYSWTGPGGFSSTQQNPTRPNCTMNMAGTYTCTIAVGSQTNSATTEVVIYPQPTANFDFTTVCQGEPTQFTSTSTTNPSGQNITSYLWNFGDGQTSTQQNPSHTYATANTYNVTLTVGCGNGLCTNQITKSVTVYAAPVANAGPDQTIGYGGSAQLSGSGGAGTFNFHWEPANMVVNPNAQNTQTVALTQDQTYTLTVTNAQGGCSSTDQVTIHISGSAMTVSATASPNSICEGTTTQLQVNAGGGTGNFTYSWTPTTGLSNPNIYNPIANPTQTTTYTCHVTDGQTAQDVSVTVTVNHPEYTEETHYICPGSELEWNGQVYTDEDDYEYVTTTSEGCEKIITLHLRHHPIYDETTIEAAICYGETYDFFGTPFNSSVTGYPHTLQTLDHGCDSIVRLNLTVYPDNGITENEVTICPEQLPYYYEGDPSSPVGEGVHFFLLEDIHGCDSTVKLTLNVSSYFKPEVQTKYVCELPYQWIIPEADTTIVVYEEGFYTDTLSTSACDGIFRLDLHYQQVPETEHTYVDDACDSYYWPVNGQTYTTSGEYPYSVSMAPYPCSQEYRLHLTLFNSDTDHSISYDDLCNEVPFTWNWPEGNPPLPLTDNGTYMFRFGETTHGCDSALRVTVTNMRYTPAPTPISCTDAGAVVFGDTIAVVTNTEFFSFNYDFSIRETGRSEWAECEWTISKPSWQIEVISNTPHESICKVYVAERTNEFVVLTATARNSCGEVTKTFYLKSSFLDVDEHGNAPANVSIIPNPNSGNMQLKFENMEGDLNIKVYTTSGALVDSFELKTSGFGETYDYSMKRLVNGVYFFTITDGSRTITKKVVIIQ